MKLFQELQKNYNTYIFLKSSVQISKEMKPSEAKLKSKSNL